MSESQNIEERVVTYYNNLIKNNVISGTAPVTIDWMKRQRILEGRSELDIRFGYATVDRILGEKTPLAKAKHYLNEVCTNQKYELLPKISQLLAEEVNVSLPPNNSIREKYTCLAKEITIQINQINDKEILLSKTLYHTASKKQPNSELEQILCLLYTADAADEMRTV